MSRTMTDAERRAFLLEGTRTGKVAWTSPRGNVHVAPVWFTLDGDDVLFTTHGKSAKGPSTTASRSASWSTTRHRPTAT